jgi:arabinan endo-1,5-alpha-L-arabinosidase
LSVGPGHVGLLDLGDGVPKFSCHYEADLDRSGHSVPDIRPLLWKDGWPYAGDNFREGTYEIQSERSGYALELAVDFVRMASMRRGGFGAPGGPPSGAGAPGAGAPATGAPGTDAPGARGAGAAGTAAPPAAAAGANPQRGRAPGGPGANMFAAPAGPVTPVPAQDLAEASKDWAAGTLGVRLGDFMFRPHQKWTITPVAGAGGYPGAPYFKITIAGTDRALAATADAEVVAVPKFTGGPEQLWRIDQLTDGTYRIMPKSVPGSKEPFVLTAVAHSTPTLAKFDPKSDNGRWNFKLP